MTYNEAREEVLKVAGDYKNTRNLYCVRSSMLGKEVEQIKSDITNDVVSLSVSPDTLQFSIVSGDEVHTQSSIYSSTNHNSIFHRVMQAKKAEDIIEYFEHCIKFLLYIMCCGSAASLKDIQRACSYGNLAISSITDDFVSSLMNKGKQLETSLNSLELENKTYQGYCKKVESAMISAAYCWSATSMIFKPGMKISVKDLRTSNTTEVTKVRTIKRVTYSNGEPTFYFTDTASIVKGKSRIHELETYVLNTPEMFEIAETLKLEHLESIL